MEQVDLMDNNNSGQGLEAPMDAGNWRAQLLSDSRQILETLKGHFQFSVQEVLDDLDVLFEENIYTPATSRADYLRNISWKMLALEPESQNTRSNSLSPNPFGNRNRTLNPGAQGKGPVINVGDWRAQLQPDARHIIVNNIMETLKRHLPFAGQEGLEELKKIAVRHEEKIYTIATSQTEYLRKISSKMLGLRS